MKDNKLTEAQIDSTTTVTEETEKPKLQLTIKRVRTHVRAGQVFTTRPL